MSTVRHPACRRLLPAALASVAAVVLVAFPPDWHRIVAELTAPRERAARSGIDGVLGDLGSTVLWLLAFWLLLALALTWIGSLPNAAGRLAERVGRRMLPIVVRRLLVGGAGFGVLLAPVAASAATTHTATTHTASVSTNTTSISARLASAPEHSPTDPTPSPRWPQSPQARSPKTPQTPQTPQTPRWPSNSSSTTQLADSGEEVTVRTGDSLWLIAGRRLGPEAGPHEIARAWPRWYAANRDGIGDDPAHLTPGQVLHAPNDSPDSGPNQEARS